MSNIVTQQRIGSFSGNCKIDALLQLRKIKSSYTLSSILDCCDLMVISLNFGKQFNCSSVSQPLVYSKKDLSTSSQSLFSFQLDAWLDSFFKLKCTGADLLDPFLLQLYVPLIAESLTHTFNLTIISGANSRVWKVAHVLPLHKAGDPSDLHIYCPISKLSCLSTFRLCLP